MKIKSKKEWEMDLKERFLKTEIYGIMKDNGSIGINKGSIADEFIREFNERLKQLKKLKKEK